jgi:hypothetical protein
MSRELDLLSKEFQRRQAIVLRSDVSLYQTTIGTASGPFLRAVEAECKRQKQGTAILVAVVPEPKQDSTN